MIPAIQYFNLPAELLTSEIEEEFFSSLKLRNGTYKTTFQKRFSDINKQILVLLKTTDIKVDNILDIGISSGISTLELVEDLNSAGYTNHIVGTDLLMDAYIVHIFPGCYALVDNTGYPLRFDLFKWSIKPWIIRTDYHNGFFIFRKFINLIFVYRAKNLIAKSKHADVQKVKLITPKLLSHTNVVIQMGDITKFNYSYREKFNFIRAANILNVSYFTKAELVAIINNIKHYFTKPSGTLLVVRTHEDGSNHGSLFNIANHSKCEVIGRFGAGSEIEDIVLASINKH